MPQLQKYVKAIAVFVIGAIVLSLGIISFFLQNHSSGGVEILDNVVSNESEAKVLGATSIYVEIGGAVNVPGLYQFQSGARIEDAINKAKGISPNANLDFVSKNINRASKLSDGQKIYIPNNSENISVDQGGDLININTADNKTLEKLSGVGPVTAQKILDNRPYSKLEDLLDRKIVSAKIFEQIKDKISLY